MSRFVGRPAPAADDKMMRLLVVSLVLAQSLVSPPRLAAQVPTPESHFGFRMGSDRQLAAAADIDAYFELVAARSDRVVVVDIGRTTDGHRTIAAIISAPENIQNLARDPRRQSAARRSADAVAGRGAPHRRHAQGGAGDRQQHSRVGSRRQPGRERAAVFARDRHAIARRSRCSATSSIILIPSLNPDGQRLIADWYERTKGTAFEGAPMPWLDHRYAGHDINRDAFMMNLAESRNLARVLLHRSGTRRCFSACTRWEATVRGCRCRRCRIRSTPTTTPLIWREAALLGGAMALELQRDGHTGVDVEHDLRLLLAGLRGFGAARPQHGGSVDRGRGRQPGDAAHGCGRRPARPEGLCRAIPLASIFPIPGRAAGGVFATSSTTTSARCAACCMPSRRTGNESSRAFTTWAARAVDAGRRGGPVRVRHPAGSVRPACHQEARRAAASGRGRNPSRARVHLSPTARRIPRAATSSCWRSRTAPT